MPTRLTIIPTAAAVALALAACGSSSSAPGIEQAPSGGATADTTVTPTPTSSTPTTSTQPTATTPASGPLSKEPTVSVPSGAEPKTLIVRDLIKGTGATATPSSTVTVNYVGVLYKNGKQFDASWKHGQPFTTALNAVIPGWTKGIPGMKVGGRRELIIPSALGYGANGSPPTIPPNAALVFVVDLLGVS
jgi:peptidylprolyl isomerase